MIASTSAQFYKGTNKPLADISRELGVDYVLEGSVRWQTLAQGYPRIRVTPKLVSARDGTHLWAEIYDQPLDEIFRIQGDIAQKVVRALDVTVINPPDDASRVPTRSLEAYDYYLRGRDYRRRGSEERFARAALRMFESAVALDSGFALAYVALAQAHSQMYWQHYDRSEERRALQKRAVDRVLALAPDLPESHLALAGYYMSALDYEPALRELAIAESSGVAVLPISGPVEIVKLRRQDVGFLLPGAREFARGASAE